MKMRYSIKYIIGISGILIGLFFLFAVIKNFRQPSTEEKSTASSQSNQVFDSASLYSDLPNEQFKQIWAGNLLGFQKEKPMLSDADTKTQKTAKISLSKESHDFGTVDGGTTVTHEVTLTNLDQSPLRITSIESSCTCTVATPTGQLIPPGKQTQINMKLHLPKANKQVKEIVTIHTDNPQQPTLGFTLKATAYMPIAAMPNQVFFGRVPFGQSARKEIILKKGSEHQIKLEGLRSSSELFAANYLGSDTQGNWKIEVVLKNQAPIEIFEGKIFIDYKHQENESTLGLPVIGEVVGHLNIFPKRFFFGLVVQGEEASKTITLSNTLNQPFKVLRAVSQSSHITTQITPLPDGVVFALGRIVWKKGFDYLIRSIPKVLEQTPNLKVIIGGDGSDLPALKQLVGKLGLDTVVHFPGAIYRNEIPAYFHLCDIFVMPAVHDPKGNVDTCPNVILEAMGSGKPVVASNISGIPLVVSHEETGLLVEEKNTAQLAEAIIRLLASKPLRDGFGQAGLEKVRCRLTWSNIAQQFIEVYKSALRDA